MMMDIFSLFDPHFSSSFSPTTLPIFIFIPSLIILITPASWPLFISQKTSLLSPMLNIILAQLDRSLSKHLKGLNPVITSMFITIIFVNLLGMCPYQFSPSSHLVVTLSLGLPCWLSMIISSLLYNPKQFIAHLLPEGAPDWLNPFLTLIETSSTLVRPLTLSFRLAANMTAGHVVLSLINVYAGATLMMCTLNFSLLLLISSGYTLFEFAICLIQAYIFCLLLSLYSDDHSH